MEISEFSRLDSQKQLDMITNCNSSTPLYLERLKDALNGRPESIIFLGNEIANIYNKLMGE